MNSSIGTNRSSARRLEIITILVLLSLILLVRLQQLAADPPSDLSISTDVYTDPAQYTLFARTCVNQGDLNPFDDHRHPVFLKSTVTVLAVVVFKALGVGVWQSNLVGLLYAFGALVLFFLFIRRVAGRAAGLLYLLLISFNYNQIFYGRLPFLENAMAFYAFLALVLVVYCRRWVWFLPAGLSLGAAIFFGKMIGMAFVFPFACYFVYRWFYDKPHRSLLGPLLFTVGLATVALFWYFFTYAPMKEQVAGYFGEQAVSLYGSPEGLRSIGDFVWKMVSLGEKEQLFSRMPVVGLLGAAFIMMILYHVGRARSWREGFGSLNAGHIFLGGMIVAFYGSLMIWNYRPMRYQLVMIYPFYGAAATILAAIWYRKPSSSPEKVPLLFYLLSIPVVVVPLYQFCQALFDADADVACWEEYKHWLLSIAAAITVLVGAGVARYRLRARSLPNLMPRVLLVLIWIALPFDGVRQYHRAWQGAAYTIRDCNIDLGAILSPGAVVSGPFGPTLTLANELDCIIHMFGVSQPDPGLFMKFPVTHLLLDEANEIRAKEDYPEIMDGAVHRVTYRVGSKKVRLFSVVGLTGNSVADNYRRSLYEETVDLDNAGASEEAMKRALAFLEQYPQNSSCYLLLGEKFQREEYMKQAETMFKKAVEFSPTNYHLNARLAEFYKDWFLATGESRLKELGLKYYDRAMEYNLKPSRIEKARRELEESLP
ncbi:MAG: hypothetical protein ABII79_12765 [bacterium]